MRKDVLKVFFIKKRPKQKCFPVNIAKEQLRTAIMRKTSEWLLR